MAVVAGASCAVIISLALTLLGAAVLLWPRKQLPPPPLWCLYDIDNPFDVARSGPLCDLIVLCCLVDERALDVLSGLGQSLRDARLETRVLVMPWRAGDDWFWQQLCSAHVTTAFVQVFLSAVGGLPLAGVVRSPTSECDAEAALLEQGLLERVARVQESRAIRAAVWPEPIERSGPADIGDNKQSTHVLIWHPEQQHLDGPGEQCRFNVTKNVAEESAARRLFQNATIVHVVSASWSLVHSGDPMYSVASSSDSIIDSAGSLNKPQPPPSNPSCGTYPIRGSRSVYIRPLPRALRQLVTRFVGVHRRGGGRAVLVTDIADDEAAADSVGKPQATILRQMYQILRGRIVSY